LSNGPVTLRSVTRGRARRRRQTPAGQALDLLARNLDTPFLAKAVGDLDCDGTFITTC
jgi:hypothetical protein